METTFSSKSDTLCHDCDTVLGSLSASCQAVLEMSMKAQDRLGSTPRAAMSSESESDDIVDDRKDDMARALTTLLPDGVFAKMEKGQFRRFMKKRNNPNE